MALQIGQSVMHDNGAFSMFTRKRPVDWNRYYDWLQTRLAHPHWAVVPDVIDGDEDMQRELVAQWPYPPSISAPVWHMGLSLDYLAELSDNWPRICFGSTAQFWDVGGDDWARRCDEAFNLLSRQHRHLPWIHMLRGLSQAGKQWPFASADSVNVARNHKDTNRDPELMAAQIDRVQCPVFWKPRQVAQQLEAFV